MNLRLTKSDTDLVGRPEPSLESDPQRRPDSEILARQANQPHATIAARVVAHLGVVEVVLDHEHFGWRYIELTPEQAKAVGAELIRLGAEVQP